MADNGGGSMFTNSSPCRECTNYKNGLAEPVFLCSLSLTISHVLMLAIVSCITFTLNILDNHTRPYLTLNMVFALKQTFQVKQVSYPMVPHIGSY